MTASKSFPLRGVIGVVANAADEIDQAIAHQLQCVEIRADLLLDSGLSMDDVLALIQRATRAGIASLLTLRHPGHGGKFNGSEQERVEINRRALAAGADLIDLEWQSEASIAMLAEGAPLILSHHDFANMPDDAELARITKSMLQAGSAAVKLVPTAATLADSIRMLQWVAEADESTARIGFAMGAAGECSRILTTRCGAPITYTSFGPAVAPGQIALEKLLAEYRVMEMSADTAVVAVSDSDPQVVAKLNRSFAEQRENKVAVGFAPQAIDLLETNRQLLGITTMQFE